MNENTEKNFNSSDVNLIFKWVTIWFVVAWVLFFVAFFVTFHTFFVVDNATADCECICQKTENTQSP